MGTVVYEGLLVAERPGNAPDFIASCQVIETRFYLKKNEQQNRQLVIGSKPFNQSNQLRLN